MTRRRPSFLGAYAVVGCCFLLLPTMVVIIASLTTAKYVGFPPEGIGIQAYLDILNHPEFTSAFQMSFVIALMTSACATVLGIPAAMALTRYRFRGRDLLSTFFLSPLMLPTIVIGLALLLVYVRWGITKTILSLVIGHIIITTPYTIRLVGVSLAGFDRNLELAAKNLGASPWDAFRAVTLPIIMPGVLAGAVFAFIVSWNEVNVALFLSSSRAPTLPVRIFEYITQQSSDPFITAISSVLVFITLAAIVVIERTVGLGRVFGTG